MYNEDRYHELKKQFEQDHFEDDPENEEAVFDGSEYTDEIGARTYQS